LGFEDFEKETHVQDIQYYSGSRTDAWRLGASAGPDASAGRTQQGVPASSITAAGFGKTRPIASNDTSEGRQLNRRVELIVSGEVIGTKIVSLSLQPVVAVTSPQ